MEQRCPPDKGGAKKLIILRGPLSRSVRSSPQLSGLGPFRLSEAHKFFWSFLIKLFASAHWGP